MSHSLQEIAQCRLLLQLALERLDSLERQISQSQNSGSDQHISISHSQNLQYDEQNISSHSQNGERDIKSTLSHSQISESGIPTYLSHSQIFDRGKGPFPPQSQNSERVEAAVGLASEPSLDALRRSLRAGALKGMPRRSIKSAALILLHLRKYPGRHGYRELAPIASLTERSLVVHMGALRRRGVLEKVAFQQYKLTALAEEAMASAASAGA
jgi:hypothetical protein